MRTRLFPLIQFEKQVKTAFSRTCVRGTQAETQGAWESNFNANFAVFRHFFVLKCLVILDEFFPTCIVFKNLLRTIDLHFSYP